MKKIFLSLLLTGLIISYSSAVKAEDFQTLVQQKKPLALLVYADWADNSSEIQQAFIGAQVSFGSKYNFKILNIADKETKEFNKTNYIYSNLPYVMLYKNGGKITRWLNKDCVLNSSCFNDKLSLFAD